MGSLFDGIGGFPLAAVRNGITPVWASEIEAFPIEVTKHHFPGMIHVGTSLNWTGQNCRLWTSSAAAALVRISVWLEREPVCPAPAPAFLWNKFGS